MCYKMSKLQTIFDRQETEDQFVLENDLVNLTLNDFENGIELLQCLEAQSISINSNILQVTPLPVRAEYKFAIRKHTSSIKAYWHSHNFYELIYVYNGKCTQYISMSENPIYIYSGGFCIIKPGEIHALEPSGIDDLIVKIRIPSTMFCNSCQEYSQLFLNNSTNGIIIMSNVAGSKTGQWFQELVEEYYFGDEYSKTAIQGYLSLILVDVLRMKQNHLSPFIQAVNDYLERNLNIASLKAIAVYLGYHPTYLSRRISLETGQTFSQLLQKHRLGRATHLLLHSGETVENIAEMLGYKNPSGFYKAFTLKYGLPPGEFRNINIVEPILY